MRAVLLALVLGSALGCLKRPTFECASTAECDGVGLGATCEADGFCSFTDDNCPSGSRYGDNSGPNAGQCVGGDPSTGTCFGSGVYQVCFDDAPTGTVDLAGAFDTTSDPRCAATQAWSMAGQPDACFVAGAQVTVSGALDVTGSRPLVLVGEAIQIDALIDASSAHTGEPGPAANATACSAFVADATDGAPVGAGGAGASFMTAGGNGGRADNNNGRPGGVAPGADAAHPATLRGGCGGQVGGDGAGPGGLAGSGGGAVYVAATTIAFAANAGINASGAGGRGTNSGGGGGGGGGSGGMIVLSATAITADDAVLIANGGGGASGSDTGGNPADDGDDPDPATPTMAAVGGNGAGGAGGRGFGGASQAIGGSSGNNNAGGGGGGGAGYIQSTVALTGAAVSPAATVVP